MLLALFFVVQVVMLAGFWSWLAGRATAAGIAVWLTISGIAAGAGWLNFGPLPPPVVFVIVPGFLVTLALAFSGWGRVRIMQTSLTTLIGFQAFRIGVEIFLWWGHREGVVPAQLTWEGRNFDILTGISAVPMALAAGCGRAPKWLVDLWNVAGLALLANVVSVAVLSMPTGFQHFEPANLFVAGWPYIWLPAFLVPSALMGHLLVWRALRRA